MTHLECSRTINASPDSVWAALSDYMAIDAIAPEITKVDALSSNASGLGAKRRCHFPNGSSLVEEAISWTEGRGFRVEMTEMGKIPFKEAQRKFVWPQMATAKPMSSGRSIFRSSLALLAGSWVR